MPWVKGLSSFSPNLPSGRRHLEPLERRRLGTPGSNEPRSSLAISPGWRWHGAQVGRVRTCKLETLVAEDYEALNAAQTVSETDPFTAYRYAQFARHLRSAMRILDVS